MIEIKCTKCPVVHICNTREHPSSNNCPLLAILVSTDSLLEPQGSASKSYHKAWEGC